MKKFTYILAIAMFLVGNSAFASFPFNSHPKDCPTISIGNATTGVGAPSAGSNNCTSWSLTNVNANVGDVINVHVYYHNTSSAPATNVKINLVQSTTGPSTNFSFTGTLASDQGNTPMGPVSVNLPTSQTLTFSEVVWYPDQGGINDISRPVSNPSSIMNGGINIGTVGNTKPAYQGDMVVSFIVGSTITPPPSVCAINSFTPSQSSVASGQPVNLNWSTTGASSVTYNGVQYATPGYVTVYPYATTTYNIVANCTNGTYVSGTTTVYVNTVQPTLCQINRFSATPSNITYSGQAMSLYWDTVGVSYVVIDGTTYYTSSGYTNPIYPTSDRTYYMKAYCTDGTQLDRNVYVSVNYINTYNSLTLTTNLPTNVTTSSATLNGYINANGNNASRWFRYGTTASTMNNTTSVVGHGTGASNVADTATNLSPNTTYYYQVVASDIQGTHYEANIRQFNTNASFIPVNGNTSAVTTLATNVAQTNAQLNGLLLNTSGLATSTYFEYGKDVVMNQRTASKAMGAGTNIQLSDFVSNLTPNTFYYFRANGENTNGRVFGSIQVFHTPGNAAPVPPTIITRVGAESPIMLKIEDKYELFNIGDTVDYTVTYKNIGATTLTNPLLQVVIPTEVTYTNSSRGTYDINTKTLSVQLETLTPGAGGVVYVQGKVVSLPDNHAQIVTTALLNYTNSNGAQESAMAYVLNHDNGGNINNNLTANALFAGGFWPTTLCGWLLLLIILILIALLIRWLLGKRDERTRVIYKNNNNL